MTSKEEAPTSFVAMETMSNATTETPLNITTDTSSERIPSLEELNELEIERLIPTIVYLLIISMFGIIGNGLVCHVYRTRYRLSNSQCFILCLSAIDMFSCCIVIPTEIATIVRQYTFKYVLLCKFSRFFNTMGALSASFLLLFIAIDRYRKVCKPFGWQVSSRAAKCLCALSIILGLLTSWPAVFIYGTKAIIVPVYGIMGTECSTDDKMADTMFPFINTAVFGTLFITGIVSICVLYCFIGSEVKRHVNRMPKEFRNRNPSVPMLSGTVDIDARDPRLSTADIDDAEILAKYKKTKNDKNVNNRSSKYKSKGNRISTSDVSWGDQKDYELSYNMECSSSKGQLSQHIDHTDMPMKNLGIQSDSEDSGIKSDQIKEDGEITQIQDNINNSTNDRNNSTPEMNKTINESENSKDKTTDVCNERNNEDGLAPEVGLSPSASKEKLNKTPYKSTRSRMSSISSRISYAISRMTSIASRNGTDSNASALGKKQYMQQARARKTAFLMFLISLAFVLSYLPHLLLMLIRQLKDNFVESMSDDGRAVYKFLLRSYFLNCAINPVIYGVCDARFRTACKELFGRCCRKTDTSDIN